MKRLAAWLGILALGACQAEPKVVPLDCKSVVQRELACMHKLNTSDARRVSVECAKAYSSPKRIEGTWAFDFEFNEFFENREVPPPEAWRIPEQETALYGALGEGDLPRDKEGRKLANVSYVVIDARRPLCDLTPGYKALIVDRVISTRLIASKVSPWN